jgi:dynein heavy chain 1, cytosolic
MQMKWESFVHSFDPHHRPGAYLANGTSDGSAHPPVRESRHVQFVRDFALSTSTLQMKTDTLISIHDEVLYCLNELKSCVYESNAFTETIRKIQDHVDRMNLENYVNLIVWVEELNCTIEEILLERLKQAIVAWVSAFNSEERAGEAYGHKRQKTYNQAAEDHSKIRTIELDAILHELTIRNQVIFLEPPLEQARATCFSSLHTWLGKIPLNRLS